MKKKKETRVSVPINITLSTILQKKTKKKQLQRVCFESTLYLKHNMVVKR